MERYHPTSPKKLKATLSGGKSMFTVSWNAEGVVLVDIMRRGQTRSVHSYLTRCRSTSGGNDLIKLLLKSFFNTTTHDRTQVWKHRQESQNLDGLFFPTYYTSQILLRQIATTLEPSKMPSVGKGLGLVTRLNKKWRSEKVAASTEFKLLQEGHRCSSFSLKQGCGS